MKEKNSTIYEIYISEHDISWLDRQCVCQVFLREPFNIICSVPVAILTVLCVLLERYPKAVFGTVGFAAAAAFLRSALANGFQVISNGWPMQ